MIFKNMKKNGLILGAFALASTALLVATQNLTADRIERQQRSELMRTLNTLIPENLHTNDLFSDCTLVQEPDVLGRTQAQQVYRARIDNHNTALAIKTTAPNGYSGNIDLIVAISAQQRVLGVRVLQHRETPGLGDKIEMRKSNWILGFNDEQIPTRSSPRWEVRKDGGAFDQFTGATITPRAVINAVERTIIWARDNQRQLFAAESNCQAGEA